MSKTLTQEAMQEQLNPSHPLPQVASVIPMPVDEGSALLGMIERLFANPRIGAEKAGLAYDLYERAIARRAKIAFDAAIVACLPELPVIVKDGRIEAEGVSKKTGKAYSQNTPYARWEKIVPEIKPILAKHGLGLRHRIETAPEGKVRVTAVLTGHGHTDDSCYMDLGADTTGSKNNAQAWASAVSYAKRHTACAALNIVSRDEDDDGRASGDPVMVGTPLTDEQVQQIVDFCAAVECPGPKLIEHLNKTRPNGHPEIKTIGNLPVERFDETIAALRSYESNKKARQETK